MKSCLREGKCLKEFIITSLKCNANTLLVQSANENLLGFSAKSWPDNRDMEFVGQKILSNKSVSRVESRHLISLDCRAINPFWRGGKTPILITKDAGSINSCRLSSVKRPFCIFLAFSSKKFFSSWSPCGVNLKWPD